MKRTIALIAALILLGQFALASAAELSPYKALDGKYSVSYPAEWMMLDKDSVADWVEQAASGEITVPGINAEALRQYGESMKNSPLVLFMSPETGDNVNITYVEEPGLAAYTVDVVVQQLGGMLAQQFQAVYGDYEPLDIGSTLQIGDRTFGHTSGTATVNGFKSQQIQLYFLTGGTLYYLTFTFRLVDGELPEGALQLMHQVAESFDPA